MGIKLSPLMARALDVVRKMDLEAATEAAAVRGRLRHMDLRLDEIEQLKALVEAACAAHSALESGLIFTLAGSCEGDALGDAMREVSKLHPGIIAR
jgi:hypothetical protein